jgi:hypothetical protein
MGLGAIYPLIDLPVYHPWSRVCPVLVVGHYPRYMQIYTPDIVCHVNTVSLITLIDH